MIRVIRYMVLKKRRPFVTWPCVCVRLPVLLQLELEMWTHCLAHAGSRTRVTSMGGLYDTATLHAPLNLCLQHNNWGIHVCKCLGLSTQGLPLRAWRARVACGLAGGRPRRRAGRFPVAPAPCVASVPRNDVIYHPEQMLARQLCELHPPRAFDNHEDATGCFFFSRGYHELVWPAIGLTREANGATAHCGCVARGSHNHPHGS